MAFTKLGHFKLFPRFLPPFTENGLDDKEEEEDMIDFKKGGVVCKLIVFILFPKKKIEKLFLNIIQCNFIKRANAICILVAITITIARTICQWNLLR